VSGNLRENLTGCIDKVLEVREKLGAQKADVFFITRTWTGRRPGDGTFKDVSKQMKPTPSIKDFSHDIRLQAGGNYKAGDLLLIGISRNQFPDESKLLTTTGVSNITKFIKVGPHFYRTITIKENFVTWDIHVRKTRQDQTERS